MLEKSLESSGFAVCVKDAQKTVIEQNALCREICGDCLGTQCEKGCMEIYAKDESSQWKDWGSRVYKNSFMHGSFFDVTLLCSTDSIITFLQPLRDKYEAALACYRNKGLTRRETEVAALAIQGTSNPEICKSLAISKATLRTHLNNIYRKFRDLGEEPVFLPASRLKA